MCGRFALTTPPDVIAKWYELMRRLEFSPRYNIAPTQQVLAVRRGDDQQREGVFLHWGLIPFWAKDASIGSRLINARSESAADKPSFRAAMKKRRCLIPASGFYEWKKRGNAKQPYYIAVMMAIRSRSLVCGSRGMMLRPARPSSRARSSRPMRT